MNARTRSVLGGLLVIVFLATGCGRSAQKTVDLAIAYSKEYGHAMFVHRGRYLIVEESVVPASQALREFETFEDWVRASRPASELAADLIKRGWVSTERPEAGGYRGYEGLSARPHIFLIFRIGEGEQTDLIEAQMRQCQNLYEIGEVIPPPSWAQRPTNSMPREREEKRKEG